MKKLIYKRHCIQQSFSLFNICFDRKSVFNFFWWMNVGEEELTTHINLEKLIDVEGEVNVDVDVNVDIKLGLDLDKLEINWTILVLMLWESVTYVVINTNKSTWTYSARFPPYLCTKPEIYQQIQKTKKKNQQHDVFLNNWSAFFSHSVVVIAVWPLLLPIEFFKRISVF